MAIQFQIKAENERLRHSSPIHPFPVARMLMYLFEYVLQIFFPAALLAGSEIAQLAVPTVGPQSTLYVTNEFIAPDGFRRSYFLQLTPPFRC